MEVVTSLDAALPPDQYYVGGAEAVAARTRDVRGLSERVNARRQSGGKVREGIQGRKLSWRGVEGIFAGSRGVETERVCGGCVWWGLSVEEPALSWRRAPPPAKR